jgi:hypothetical protein
MHSTADSGTGGIELLDCFYSTLCRDDNCTARATLILRYINYQFRPISQLGYCRMHAQRLIDAAGRRSVIDAVGMAREITTLIETGGSTSRGG